MNVSSFVKTRNDFESLKSWWQENLKGDLNISFSEHPTFSYDELRDFFIFDRYFAREFFYNKAEN